MDSYTSTSTIGLVVLLGVIGIPLYVLAAATIFGVPGGSRIKGTFAATIVVILATAIVFTFIGAGIFSLIIPD